MEIVAQVYDWKITKTELDFEENLVRSQFPDAEQSEVRTYAISQLIDRYLLMQEAISHGICVDDDEFEDALLNMIDLIEAPETSVLINRSGRGEQIERVVKSNLIVQKYLDSITKCIDKLDEDKLYQFYLDRNDYFSQEDEVRASHILLKDKEDSASQNINEIRNKIRTPQDFFYQSKLVSECPSSTNCGDLGFFPKGRMIPEIEKVAFSLKVNEISQPFQSKYGYHILMVTDKKEKSVIPYEQIKESLKASLADIEKEVTLTRILTDIHSRCKDSITIFEHAFE
jgi:hypothetical protein